MLNDYKRCKCCGILKHEGMFRNHLSFYDRCHQCRTNQTAQKEAEILADCKLHNRIVTYGKLTVILGGLHGQV